MIDLKVNVKVKICVMEADMLSDFSEEFVDIINTSKQLRKVRNKLEIKCCWYVIAINVFEYEHVAIWIKNLWTWLVLK